MPEEKQTELNELSDDAVKEIHEMLQHAGWTRLKNIMQLIINAIHDKHFITGPKDITTYIRDVSYVQALTGVMQITDHADDLFKTLLTEEQKGTENGKPNTGQRRGARGYGTNASA